MSVPRKLCHRNKGEEGKEIRFGGNWQNQPSLNHFGLKWFVQSAVCFRICLITKLYILFPLFFFGCLQLPLGLSEPYRPDAFESISDNLT